MSVKGQVLRSASIIAAVTAISRICGYLRDQRVALLLGTSPAADAFILAFRIPNLIRRVTAGGGLAASFIPVFTGQLREKSRREAITFAQHVFWDLGVALAVVAVLGVAFSRQVVYAFTLFGNTHLRLDLTILLNRIIFPGVLFIGLAALAAAILNSFHIFGLPAATAVFFNLTVILFSFAFIYRPIMGLAPETLRTPAIALAAGVLLGTVVSFAIQVPELWKKGLRFAPAVSWSDPGVRKVGRLMGPGLFGMGVYQVNFFVDTVFATASRMPTGSVTSLYVADRVMELVLGAYAIAMSTALLPLMSHQAAAGKFVEMKSTFAFSVRIVSFITIPASVGLILLRRPIIQVLFEHGRFVAESTALTSHALLFYSLGLPAYAVIKLITPMYYSTQDTLTPARVGLWALIVNVALNTCFLFFLFRYLANGTPALASSMTAYFNFALLFAIFRKRYGRLGAKEIIVSLSKMACGATAMACAGFAALRYSHLDAVRDLAARGLPDSHFAIHGFAVRAALLAGIILLSMGVYFGAAVLLRCEELPELLAVLRRGRENIPLPIPEP